ncbi:patatin-like phospholipase family protein [Antrihabitans cavernicola]|uniref:Patatin-like phospholipase family protein n=1 Tax=Antrihabitans cavernicola TaxID=2495913 RepID=A0A5A7SJF0_9NOCA|nr:patatin-like phospholipase family protein [Spelaeibacter cavernicola]KAA0024763.1 patatin-like phospholipase family protein [Spelaeibacter cavernicola]
MPQQPLALDELENGAIDDPDLDGDIVEAPEDVGLTHRNPPLALQHMEAALTRADVEYPGILDRQEFRRLRYLIAFARLDTFEPGAAGPGGTRGRGDVSVGDELVEFRDRVLKTLHDPLRAEPDLRKRLRAAKAALVELIEPLETARRQLAEHHADTFSLAELDAEVGYKSLVCVLGGGGGSGYVFFGAMDRMVESGLTPSYMLGASFGSVVGSVTARTRPVPTADYIDWAKTVTWRGTISAGWQPRRHGLTGLGSLTFDTFADDMFRRTDGAPMRMKDLEIPYETVVAGVRRQSFDRLPGRFRRSELSSLGLRQLPFVRYGGSAMMASRMWQAAAFIDSRVVKPIVLGGDELTENLNVVDAVSYSAAIPTVLQHESKDPAMFPILDELLKQKDVGALVDGGAASNVPVELAWKRIQDGKLGTRNACYVAWDSFHPQWNPSNLWLQPVAHALQVQMVRNAPYADRIVRFRPTLSPVSLAPPSRAVDRAAGWGRATVDASLPMVEHLMEPVWWDGEGPPKPPRSRKKAKPSVARPVEEVLAKRAKDGSGLLARFARRGTKHS